MEMHKKAELFAEGRQDPKKCEWLGKRMLPPSLKLRRTSDSRCLMLDTRYLAGRAKINGFGGFQRLPLKALSRAFLLQRATSPAL
jgi:hypothetical protein